MNEIKKLEEELFCTKYELDTLAEIILNGKAERWLPSFTGSIKDDDHIGRYNIACNYVNGLKVLDIACGAGKGSQLLGTKGQAKSVLGADINTNAVRYASHRYGAPNISFLGLDGLDLNSEEEFDVVISFETIEHINLYKVFLKNIWNSLKPGGLFIVSTPISGQAYDSKPLNPFHEQEWGYNEFHNVLINEKFTITKIYVQLDHQLKGPSIFQRIKKRLLYKKENIKHYTGYNEKRIEEFTGQYDVNEFGKTRNGFQIVLCKKR